MKNRIRILFLLVSLFFSWEAFAQEGSIYGIIVNTENEPIRNVRISLLETKEIVSSDEAGRFEFLKLNSSTYFLLIEKQGFKSEKKKVELDETSRVKIEIVLKSHYQEIGEIQILQERSNRIKEDSNSTVGKLPLADMENPQVYNSIPKELLKEQLATDFNDAMKNATGITRLWESTGRGGDGAEFYSMRGFSVQPTMVNGVPSVNNGVIDPVNIESVQVIKGPSGTLFGSPMISYGGLINITTKKPYDKLGGEVSALTGNFGLYRLTGDVNVPVTDNVAVRLNAAYNEQGSFQDAGFRKSLFVAPSIKFQASDRLTFLINTEFSESNSANAPMVFLNRYGPISFNSIDLFENHYRNSFTSNDLSIKNSVNNIQTEARYTLSKQWTSQTIVSRSNSKSQGYYQYLWDLGDGESFLRYISNRDGATLTTDVQQNFIGDFKIGNLRNRLVVGLDYYQSNITNQSSGWVGNGIVNLKDGTDSGELSAIGVDSLLLGTFEGVSSATNEVMSAYFSNVINITPSLNAMISLRVDNFKGRTAYWSNDEIQNQLSLSPKFGMVYQIVKNKVSLFGNYMNGFVNQAPTQVADIDGSNIRMKALEPEQANQYEFGVKTEFFKKRLSLTGSYYNILVSNKVMSDPNNINDIIQGGEVLSQGIEISAIANPINGLSLVAGFSHNETRVIKDDPANGYLNLRPEESGPSTLINFWATYRLTTTKFKGLGIGFGGNSASEFKSLNRNVTGSFSLPAYQVYNASLFYRKSNFTVTCKIDNLLNTKYYAGWSGVIPQQLRSVSVGLNLTF